MKQFCLQESFSNQNILDDDDDDDDDDVDDVINMIMLLSQIFFPFLLIEGG